MTFRANVVLVAAGIIGACITYPADAAKPQSCQKLYQRFAGDLPHKALATSGGRSLASPDTACGFSYGYSTRKGAEMEALRVCRTIAKKNNARGKCRIIESR
jgi:hypothetical protein